MILLLRSTRLQPTFPQGASVGVAVNGICPAVSSQHPTDAPMAAAAAKLFPAVTIKRAWGSTWMQHRACEHLQWTGQFMQHTPVHFEGEINMCPCTSPIHLVKYLAAKSSASTVGKQN